MHVAVLGAGVVGVTTAYYLAEAGHDVTVIDRESDVAQSCSFANGAQLSYSYTDAMASPSFLLKMPGLLAGFDRAIRVRPPVNLDLLRWGLTFLGECTGNKSAKNTLANLQLAKRSKELLDELRPKLDGDFAYRSATKLVLLSSARDLAHARTVSALKAEHGVQTEILDIDAAIDIEPGVKHMTGNYTGAVYSAGDDVGDALSFSRLVADKLRRENRCQFRLDTNIRGLIVEHERFRAVDTDQGVIDADAVVVCLGSWSPALLKPLGVDAGIYPVRGYSVTLPTGEHTTSVSVTDYARRFVISRIDDSVRIAGFADFLGYRTSRDARRVERLLDVARTCAPAVANYNASSNNAWAGFRPLTPSSQPLVGPTRIDGLYLNTGHGTLGWTLACASAELIASRVTDSAVGDPGQTGGIGLQSSTSSGFAMDALFIRI